MCFGGGCGEGICGKCHAGLKVIGGGLVLLNAFVWPKWGVTDSAGMSSLTGWLAFFGVLLVLKGVFKFVMPGCPHLKGGDEGKAPAKKGK